jgi:hypothetical protein
MLHSFCGTSNAFQPLLPSLAAFVFLRSSEQCHLYCFDVAEHCLCRTIYVAILQGRHDNRVLLAIAEPVIFRERFAFEFDPGIAAADYLQNAIETD